MLLYFFPNNNGSCPRITENNKRKNLSAFSSNAGVISFFRIELARLIGGTVYAVCVVSTAYLSPMDGDYIMGMNPYWESIHEALTKQGHQAVDYIKSLER
jgi:hypothetical protein